MKNIRSIFQAVLILLAAAWTLGAHAQQQRYEAQLQHVTVFTSGAQVERTISVNLTAGEQVITFTGLSPYTDTKSMQVRARGQLTVLGVSHRHAHPDSLERVKQLRAAERRVKETTDRQQELRARREVVEAQLEMVKTNCSVAGRTAVTPLAGIKELNGYYAQELLTLKKRTIAIDEELAQLDSELSRRQQTLDSIGRLALKTVTEVDVKVKAAQAGRADFALTYYVKSAGWYPSYDVRSEGLERPIGLSYKANIFQNTKEDWVNASVTLSSANPNRSNVAPALRTYWLRRGAHAPRYDQNEETDGSVEGKVSDEHNTPIIGASVQVVGTKLGVVTDLDGCYSLTLPQGKRQLRFSSVGYTPQTRTVSGPTLNVVLREDQASLNEVVVTGLAGHAAGLAKGRSKKFGTPMMERAFEVEEADEAPMPESAIVSVDEQQAQFGYEFEVKEPLTLRSDGKTSVTEIGRYELAATYQHRAVPRADKEAFLMADATGWQQLSLLEGEVNVFFENTFVGKSILNPTESSDTLHFSLGRDSGIRLTRTKVNERSTRRLLSSSQEQTMTWRITAKNTRKEAVSLVIEDQIPVSQDAAITVTAEELSGGHLDADHGFVSWQMQLQPGEQRELIVQYRVKYPKNHYNLIIE